MSRPAATLVSLGLAALNLTGFAGGCASDRPRADGRDDSGLTTVAGWRGGGPRRAGGPAEYAGEAVAASALVFAPPVTLDEPPLNLDRASRQPGAFFGYDEGSVEYYRLSVDDTQSFDGSAGSRSRGWGGRGSFGGSGSGWYDHYERRAVSDRVGAIRR